LNVKCAYHPDKAAVSACSECSAPLCRECETLIKGKPVCQRCIANIRAKVGAELGAQGVPPQPGVSYPPAANPYPQQPGAYPPPANAYPPQPGTVYPPQQGAPYGQAPGTGGTMYTAPTPLVQEPPNPAKLLLGVVAGLIVGIIGAIVWDKFVFYTNFQVGLIASFIGFAVGMAVVTVSGQHGVVPGVIGGLLAFFAIMFGNYLLANDVFLKHFAGQVLQLKNGSTLQVGGWLPLSLYLEMLPHMDPMDWIFVAIGVYGGYITPYRAGRRTA
jgi:hypothetical protein